ncbi:Rv3235 family protein [Acidipropionibacterium jensenii]|uniref:Rv3235 family protein n=1 Tax=Acidipropionibacterium jensenii TaxID=1749 RepID=UPI00214A9EB7|nr:Rv3235 family protein [Acidipropionibacterium jensenii]
MSTVPMNPLISDPEPVGRVLVAAGGVVLEQVADWLPGGSVRALVASPGQQPLPIDLGDSSGRPDSDLADHQGDRTGHRVGGAPRPLGRASAEAAATAVAGLFLECLSGRRPMTHLREMCSEDALSKVRCWPRGPGWRRAQVTGVPQALLAAERVDAVVMLQLADRQLAMALCLRRRTGRWCVDDARLLVTAGLAELVGLRR